MNSIVLIRVAETEDYTFGRLEDAEHRVLCVTLEEPWRDSDENGFGDTNVSRIPAGKFDGWKRMSPTRGYVVPELKGVPGRKNIQIHKGNTLEDTLGCILVGTDYGKKGTITESKKAFEKLMAVLDDDFTLTVVDP